MAKKCTHTLFRQAQEITLCWHNVLVDCSVMIARRDPKVRRSAWLAHKSP